MSFRGPFLVPRRVGEPFAEDDAEADVISAASPLELAGRRLVRQWTAAAFRRRSGTARLGDRLRQSSRREREHVRLFSTPYNGESLLLQTRRVGFVEFVRWRHRGRSLPSPSASYMVMSRILTVIRNALCTDGLTALQTRCSPRRQTSPLVPPPGEVNETYASSFNYGPFAQLYMTSSTKAKYITYCNAVRGGHDRFTGTVA